MITIRLDTDEVTPHLRTLLQEVGSNAALAKVLGRAGANELKKHFRARNADSPNKLGGKRTNFWTGVGASVQSAQTLPGRVVIPVTHPAIAQKVFGGTISARPGKALAIPVAAAAHGKSPRSFNNLSLLILGPKKTAILAKKERGEGKFTTYYVLKKSVTQSADPEALPGDAVMGAALERAGAGYLQQK